VSALDDSDERRRKAIESILFSRRFIVIYNAVLLGLLACFAALYWCSRIVRLRRRREHERSYVHPVQHQDSGNESTPLLVAGSSRDNNLSRKSSVLARFRSWMIYQPHNIPYINKPLPSNATTISIMLFLALNVFFLLYRVEISVANVFVLADRAGLLFVGNLPLLYLFAAKNQALKLLTNASYEELNIFHRRLGEWMSLLALIHAMSILFFWYTALSTRLGFSSFLAIPIIWLGLLAFISYETLYLTSLASFRQKFYEIFLGLHVFLQIAALALLWFHHHNSRPYVFAALCIFSIDRLVFRMILKSRTIKAELSVLEDGATVKLTSNWQLETHSSWWKPLVGFGIKHGWKPAEHVFLTVPALSHKHFVQAHPFTIASAAPNELDTHAWLDFIIRAQDGFSRDLLRYAQFHNSVNIRVDGPYGSSHASDILQDNDVAVIVAGGSGIAVAFPLVWSLLVNPLGLEEAESSIEYKHRVSLIWVVHDKEHLDWIPHQRLEELRQLGCKMTIPCPTRKAGRPHLPRLLQEAVESWEPELEDPTVGVVIAGPDSMNRTCRNACANLVRQGARLEVSVEKFGW
jgi:NAD(P)H-flavin reductase